eukprot:6193960-Pleurochrysis_carterae.AAC.1
MATCVCTAAQPVFHASQWRFRSMHCIQWLSEPRRVMEWTARSLFLLELPPHLPSNTPQYPRERLVLQPGRRVRVATASPWSIPLQELLELVYASSATTELGGIRSAPASSRARTKQQAMNTASDRSSGAGTEHNSAGRIR